jgi:glutaredoxin
MSRGSSAGPAILTLYTRRSCHLCLNMDRALRRLQQELDFELIVEDVDRDSRWRQLYGDKVPVLMVDGIECCHYFLDEALVRRYLQSR